MTEGDFIFKHQSFASHMPQTRVLACNPGMCPDQELNWRPFGSQSGAQSTEPHKGRTMDFNKTEQKSSLV